MDCYFRQYWRDSRLKFQGPMKTLSLSIKVISIRLAINQKAVLFSGHKLVMSPHQRPESNPYKFTRFDCFASMNNNKDAEFTLDT